MASVRFADVQSRPTEFLDFTSLTLDEFQQLVPPFEAAFQAHMAAWRLDGKPRTARRFSVYQNCPLPTPEDRLTDRKCKRSFGATPAAPAPASPTGRPTVRTALPCRPERRGCLARAPRSQAEHGAAWRWLGLDRRRRMGEGSAQGWLAGVPRRARLAPPDRAPGHPDDWQPGEYVELP